jgi:PAS domain-containing protein
VENEVYDLQKITDVNDSEENILLKGDGKYRMLLEASTDAIFLETEDEKLIDCNSSACRMFGYSRDELI